MDVKVGAGADEGDSGYVVTVANTGERFNVDRELGLVYDADGKAQFNVLDKTN